MRQSPLPDHDSFKSYWSWRAFCWSDFCSFALDQWQVFARLKWMTASWRDISNQPRYDATGRDPLRGTTAHGWSFFVTKRRGAWQKPAMVPRAAMLRVSAPTASICAAAAKLYRAAQSARARRRRS